MTLSHWRVTRWTGKVAALVLFGVLVLPVGLFLAMLIKISAPWERAFFKDDERLGLHGKNITIWKLRSMKNGEISGGLKTACARSPSMNFLN